MRPRNVVPIVMGVTATFLFTISVGGWSKRPPWSRSPAQTVAAANIGPIGINTAIIDGALARDEVVRTVSNPWTTVPLEIVRNGAAKTVNVTIAALEDDSAAAGPPRTAQACGITLRDLESEARLMLRVPEGRSGPFVTSVERGGPGSRAGLRAGDVVLEVNRKPVASAADAIAALRQHANQTALILLWRSGEELLVTMSGR